MENSLENFDVDIVFRPIAYVSLAPTLDVVGKADSKCIICDVLKLLNI